MIPCLAPIERVRLDRVLESAVVLSWKELIHSSQRRTVHVEYGTAPELTLQYVKMWSSTTRGAWDLICEYWMCSGPSRIPTAGLTFSNGYYSADLARMLEEMMRHQEGIPNSLAGKTSVNLILVQAPTAHDEREASSCMAKAYKRVGLEFCQSTGSRNMN